MLAKGMTQAGAEKLTGVKCGSRGGKGGGAAWNLHAGVDYRFSAATPIPFLRPFRYVGSMTTTLPGIDLQELKAQYDRDGFAVARGLFSPEEVEEIKAE